MDGWYFQSVRCQLCGSHAESEPDLTSDNARGLGVKLNPAVSGRRALSSVLLESETVSTDTQSGRNGVGSARRVLKTIRRKQSYTPGQPARLSALVAKHQSFSWTEAAEKPVLKTPQRANLVREIVISLWRQNGREFPSHSTSKRFRRLGIWTLLFECRQRFNWRG
jgi:hypothetical protein